MGFSVIIHVLSTICPSFDAHIRYILFDRREIGDDRSIKYPYHTTTCSMKGSKFENSVRVGRPLIISRRHCTNPPRFENTNYRAVNDWWSIAIVPFKRPNYVHIYIYTVYRYYTDQRHFRGWTKKTIRSKKNPRPSR